VTDFLLEKIETEPPDDRDFSEIRNAHLCRRGQTRRPGNGDFDDMGVAYPPFMALSEGVSTLL
jgi:hypothetical protein